MAQGLTYISLASCSRVCRLSHLLVVDSRDLQTLQLILKWEHLALTVLADFLTLTRYNTDTMTGRRVEEQ